MTPPRPDDLTAEDEITISSLVQRFDARQLAEELVRRCGCAFDHRLPDDAPPAYECGFHRHMREAAKELTADDIYDLIDLLERMIDGEPTNPDVQEWIPTLVRLKAMR